MFSVARVVVFAAAAVLVAFVLTLNASEPGYTYSVKVVVAILLLSFLSGFAQWLASRRRYQMRNVALSLLVVDQAMFCALAFVTGGISSGATSLFGVTSLVGGLLLGVPGALVATLSGGVWFSLMVVVTQGEASWLPPDQPAHLYVLSQAQAAYYYVFNILMLLLVGLLSSYLAERLQWAGGELRIARRRVEQAERMAALGRLAAGLAHEIRNPLGAISGSVQMLRDSAKDQDDRELCEIVLRESARLNELVTDMMDFSRPRLPVRERVDLAAIVREVIRLLSSSGRGSADVELVCQVPEVCIIDADPGQLRQMIWNLVRNAIQASGAGGQVRVKVESGEEIVLRVQDDGAGIDSQAMTQLFDAFFTTRSQGTGLGLAVVKRIAEDHGFEIRVQSDQGEGAEFLVTFGAPLKHLVAQPS